MNEEQRVAVSDAIYKALREYDHQKRLAHDLRMVMRGKGPTIKRGTGRAALTHYLTDVVMAALRDAEGD